MRRRTLVAGGAAGLLLRPFLRIHSARGQAPRSKPVFVLAHKNQGAYPNNDESKFVPTLEGGRLRFPRALSSLSEHSHLVSVVAGVDLRNFADYDWHHSAGAQYSGSRWSRSSSGERPEEDGKPTGESVDQFLARTWGARVRVTDFARHPRRRARKPAHFVSWQERSGEVNAVPPSHTRQETFRSLLGDLAAADDGEVLVEARLRRGQSLLDHYLDDVRALRAELGGDLGAQLDAHVEGYRAFERATFSEEANATTCDPADVDPAWNAEEGAWNHDALLERARLYADMIVLSARCGLERVFAYGCVDDDDSAIRPEQWDRSFIAGENIRNVGDSGGRKYHNDLWHSAGRLANHEELEDYLFRNSFGYLVQRMAETAMGDGSLLDQSLMLYGTSMSYNHSNEAQPYVLIGGAAGRHQGDKVLTFGEKFGSRSRVSTNQVLTSVCHLMDIERDHFGEPEFGMGGVSGL